MKSAFALLLMLSAAAALSADISHYVRDSTAHFIIDVKNPSPEPGEVSITAGSPQTGSQGQIVSLAPYEQKRVVFDFEVGGQATFEVSVKSGRETVAYRAVQVSPQRPVREQGVDIVSYAAMLALLLAALVFLVPFFRKGKVPFGFKRWET